VLKAAHVMDISGNKVSYILALSRLNIQIKMSIEVVQRYLFFLLRARDTLVGDRSYMNVPTSSLKNLVNILLIVVVFCLHKPRSIAVGMQVNVL